MRSQISKKDVLLTQDLGVVSHCVVIEEDVLAQGTRLSGADRRRNARLERLRELVPASNAILGIDLADERQQAVLCDHDSRVLKRWKVTAKAWRLGALVDAAVAAAAGAGFRSVTVACEPTGHRWQVVTQLAADRTLPAVCIQPLVMRRAREQEDLSAEKTDAKDAVLIARLAGRLHCYEPERIDERWGRLRHAGIRREQLVVESTAQRQQIRDLLECVWPAALAAAPKDPFASATWLACLYVAVRRGGHPERAHRGGRDPFHAAVRHALSRFGGVYLRKSIVAGMFAALADPTGVRQRRTGALQRVGWVLDDLAATRRRLAEAEKHLVEILHELDLTELVCSIPGVSAVGAAAILAEAGDPTRFSHARALVKHAGLAPRLHESGEYRGTTRITGRGRPRLRLAAWRAVFGALPHNPILRERYRHLTTRATNPLTDGQARASLAATLLRWLHIMTTQRLRYHELTTVANLALAA
jgi:transposase